jgi:hypothetical protein
MSQLRVTYALCALLFVQVSPISDRSASELASAFLDALTYASAGREKLDENHDAKEPLVAIGAEMTNQRIAKRRFADARGLFANAAIPPAGGEPRRRGDDRYF